MCISKPFIEVCVYVNIWYLLYMYCFYVYAVMCIDLDSGNILKETRIESINIWYKCESDFSSFHWFEFSINFFFSILITLPANINSIEFAAISFTWSFFSIGSFNSKIRSLSLSFSLRIVHIYLNQPSWTEFEYVIIVFFRRCHCTHHSIFRWHSNKLDFGVLFNREKLWLNFVQLHSELFYG